MRMKPKHVGEGAVVAAIVFFLIAILIVGVKVAVSFVDTYPPLGFCLLFLCFTVFFALMARDLE